jgi:hypothetical protein
MSKIDDIYRMLISLICFYFTDQMACFTEKSLRCAVIESTFAAIK